MGWFLILKSHMSCAGIWHWCWIEFHIEAFMELDCQSSEIIRSVCTLGGKQTRVAQQDSRVYDRVGQPKAKFKPKGRWIDSLSSCARYKYSRLIPIQPVA